MIRGMIWLGILKEQVKIFLENLQQTDGQIKKVSGNEDRQTIIKAKESHTKPDKL